MQPEPQPLKGFLLIPIQLHDLEYMKEAFVSMEALGGIMSPRVGVNGNRGQQVQQVPKVPQQVQKVPQQSFVQPVAILDLRAIIKVVQ